MPAADCLVCFPCSALQASTYRVANNIIVLAAFALMEQPTYVALLLKRMMPSHSQHVVRAARIGYLSWFVLKGASVLLAVSMFVEDWHLMPTWIRVNFTLTWWVLSQRHGVASNAMVVSFLLPHLSANTCPDMPFGPSLCFGIVPMQLHPLTVLVSCVCFCPVAACLQGGCRSCARLVWVHPARHLQAHRPRT